MMTGALDPDANFLVGNMSVVRLIMVRRDHSSRGARTVHRSPPMEDPDRFHPRSRVISARVIDSGSQKYPDVGHESWVNLGDLVGEVTAKSKACEWVVGPLRRCRGRQFLLGRRFSSPDRPRMEQIGTGFRAFRRTPPTYSHPPTARFTALWLAPSGVCLGKAAGTGRLRLDDDDDLGEAIIISHSPPCGRGEVDDDWASVCKAIHSA
ncbi:uncharacterized protein BO80DRAFT_420417 [Aspergillus ibericus CBS 121593]|uniref:Uncharacterized protein n=1 Tax=Aspergillus ibericus CBS 121593 TaxID=1448316 RepID=A0A395HDS4_9EURO|nr:hypothetical protein BO80DRAFT_420417 [Aspergillus ibericus CBS 121593]RAL06121.1 hypothetical protein BO80DRAFT_420417 [Aspergillus ibericus CBS 121593]